MQFVSGQPSRAGRYLIARVLPLSVGVVVKAFSWSIVLRSDWIVNGALTGLGFA